MTRSANSLSIKAAIIRYLIRRVVKGDFMITSHELENEGRKAIEREIGSTVNPSTVSRKWRLLKVEFGSDAAMGPFQIDEEYVIVETQSGGSGRTEKTWLIKSILGESCEHIRDSWKNQLNLFEEGSFAEDQAQQRS